HITATGAFFGALSGARGHQRWPRAGPFSAWLSQGAGAAPASGGFAESRRPTAIASVFPGFAPWLHWPQPERRGPAGRGHHALAHGPGSTQPLGAEAGGGVVAVCWPGQARWRAH